MLNKEYTAEPTLARFHQSTKPVRYIEGPVGSGKSSGCVMELLMLGLQQQPDSKGVRRSRWGIFRQTYPELKSTTVKTFQHWIPDEVAPIVFSIPFTCKFVQPLNDGTRAEIEFVFLAIEGPDDVKKLLSFELTGAYMNEGRELAWEIMEYLQGRIGRYPETVKNEEGKTIFGPTRPCVIVDSNPPRTSHWLYEKFSTGETPEGWEKFTQPPAVYKDSEDGKWKLNPDAENLSHLPDDYYIKQMANGDDYISVNLAGEPGMTKKGKPVYTKFMRSKHVAKEKLNPIRGYPVICGLDFGLTPGVLFGQVTGSGLRITDEIPATDEMLEDLIAQYMQPLIAQRYQGFEIIVCGDPAGMQRSRHDKRTDFSVLRAANFKAHPATTNNIVERIAAVSWFLSREGGYQISPHCTHYIEACAGGYIFKETRNSSGQVTDTPAKNEFSHIADAGQYQALFARFGTRQQGQAQKPPDKPKFMYA